MACLFLFSMLCATQAFVEEVPLKAAEVTQAQWAAGIEARKLIRHSMASDSTWARIDHLRFKVTVHNLWGRNAVRINTDTFSLSQPRMLYVTRSEDDHLDVSGFDGVAFWEKDPKSINGMTLKISAAECVRSWWVEPSVLISCSDLRFAAIGSADFEGIACQRLAVFDPQNTHLATLWVDPISYQILQALHWKLKRSGWAAVYYQYSDYREVEGMIVAHRWRQLGRQESNYELDALEVNPEGKQTFWQNPSAVAVP